MHRHCVVGTVACNVCSFGSFTRLNVGASMGSQVTFGGVAVVSGDATPDAATGAGGSLLLM